MTERTWRFQTRNGYGSSRYSGQESGKQHVAKYQFVPGSGSGYRKRTGWQPHDVRNDVHNILKLHLIPVGIKNPESAEIVYLDVLKNLIVEQDIARDIKVILNETIVDFVKKNNSDKIKEKFFVELTKLTLTKIVDFVSEKRFEIINFQKDFGKKQALRIFESLIKKVVSDIEIVMDRIINEKLSDRFVRSLFGKKTHVQLSKVELDDLVTTYKEEYESVLISGIKSIFESYQKIITQRMQNDINIERTNVIGTLVALLNDETKEYLSDKVKLGWFYEILVSYWMFGYLCEDPTHNELLKIFLGLADNNNDEHVGKRLDAVHTATVYQFVNRISFPWHRCIEPVGKISRSLNITLTIDDAVDTLNVLYEHGLVSILARSKVCEGNPNGETAIEATLMAIKKTPKGYPEGSRTYLTEDEGNRIISELLTPKKMEYVSRIFEGIVNKIPNGENLTTIDAISIGRIRTYICWAVTLDIQMFVDTMIRNISKFKIGSAIRDSNGREITSRIEFILETLDIDDPRRHPNHNPEFDLIWERGIWHNFNKISNKKNEFIQLIVSRSIQDEVSKHSKLMDELRQIGDSNIERWNSTIDKFRCLDYAGFIVGYCGTEIDQIQYMHSCLDTPDRIEQFLCCFGMFLKKFKTIKDLYDHPDALDLYVRAIGRFQAEKNDSYKTKFLINCEKIFKIKKTDITFDKLKSLLPKHVVIHEPTITSSSSVVIYRTLHAQSVSQGKKTDQKPKVVDVTEIPDDNNNDNNESTIDESNVDDLMMLKNEKDIDQNEGSISFLISKFRNSQIEGHLIGNLIGNLIVSTSEIILEKSPTEGIQIRNAVILILKYLINNKIISKLDILNGLDLPDTQEYGKTETPSTIDLFAKVKELSCPESESESESGHELQTEDELDELFFVQKMKEMKEMKMKRKIR